MFELACGLIDGLIDYILNGQKRATTLKLWPAGMKLTDTRAIVEQQVCEELNIMGAKLKSKRIFDCQDCDLVDLLKLLRYVKRLLESQEWTEMLRSPDLGSRDKEMKVFLNGVQEPYFSYFKDILITVSLESRILSGNIERVDVIFDTMLSSILTTFKGNVSLSSPSKGKDADWFLEKAQLITEKYPGQIGAKEINHLLVAYLNVSRYLDLRKRGKETNSQEANMDISSRL